MKLIKTIVTASLSMAALFASSTTMAQDQTVAAKCSIISTKNVPINRSKRPIVLTSHNGDRDISAALVRIAGNRSGNMAKGQSNKINKYMTFVVEPGEHIFTAYANNKLIRSTMRQDRPGREFAFKITVEAGKYYNLVADKTGSNKDDLAKQFEAIITSEHDIDCDPNNKEKVFSALKRKKRS